MTDERVLSLENPHLTLPLTPFSPFRLANDTEYMENQLVEPTHLARLVGELQATSDMALFSYAMRHIMSYYVT